MRFLILGNLPHKIYNEKIYAYGPYIKEINLWLKYVDEVEIVSPFEISEPNPIDLAYQHPFIVKTNVPAFNVTSIYEKLKTLFLIPYICFKIYVAMKRADHIHIRCPNNMGLLAAFMQIFFPSKTKTVKYANNWDPNHPQPISYRLQKYIVSNVHLSKNIKVLVYGEWKNQSENIKPFFTATYHEKEKKAVAARPLDTVIKLIYIGHLGVNKRPMLCAEVTKLLIDNNHQVQLDMFGEGPEMENLKSFIKLHALQKSITLHGNQNSDIVKKSISEANFLILASKSEGWPKVIAESMFWGCVPLTTDVSCVNYMIGYGERGAIVETNALSVVEKINSYLDDPKKYKETSEKAFQWSQQYTLESFENAIKELLK